MRVVILLCLSLISLYAQALHVDQNFTSQMSGKYQTSYEDKERNLTAWDIFVGSKLTPYQKLNAGYSKSVFWGKFDITNNSTLDTTVVLQNLRAGTDYIDIYLYKNSVMSQKILLGDMRPQIQKMVLASKSAFYLTLKAHESVTVVSRFDSLGSYDLEWRVLSTSRYSYSNSLELTIMGIFGGFLLTLVLYNFTIYVNLRKTLFLAYVLHASLLLIFQYAYNGLFYFFNIGIDLLTNTLITWYVPHFMLACLGVFTILFFEFHRNNRFLTYFIGTLVALNILAGLFFIYAYWDLKILLLTDYFLIFSFLTLLSFFFIGIYAIYKGYNGGWYYLVGESVYLFSLIYLALILAGKSPSGNMVYLIPFAVSIEMFAFSLALGNRVKKLRVEHQKVEQLIMDEARFTSIGKSIGMAVHQWKDPLSQLASHILLLKAKEYEGELLPKNVRIHIDEMAKLIEYMKNTINDVYDSCTNVKAMNRFDISDAIELSIRFQKDRITLLGVDLEIQCDANSTVYGSKHALTNILMVLFDNAFDQFKSAQTNHPKIKISVENDTKQTLISFEDNGGGIAVSPISDIFEIDISSKKRKGTGMGLALAKMMVETKLNGVISIHNSENGACFEIKILHTHKTFLCETEIFN